MTEASPPDRRRMRPEDRRREVLDAALRVFAEAGFRRASLNAVSDEAGVTKGCLYHYFDSKEDLLLALMRERAQDAGSLAQALSDVTTRDELLARMVRVLWEKYEREGELDMTGVVLTELPHAPAVARAFFDEVIAPRRADLRDALVRTETTKVDPELAAMLVPWMMMGVALGYRLCGGIDKAQRTPEEIEQAALAILREGL
jgi:AcrR family transcriptional regulator